jgi:hypothetical protein
MSWKNALAYGRAIVAKHVDSAPVRVDDGLPLGGRIGGLINLQNALLIRAIASGSLIVGTLEKNSLIKAISRVRLDTAGKLYRYYLNTGEDEASKETFVQLFQGENGALSELMYCQALTRIVPETVDAQNAFTGSDGYGLGEKTYSLWRDQIEPLGYSPQALDAIFGSSESIEYTRDAGDPEQEFVRPFTGTETRVDDKGGEKGLEQQVVFMPYVRDVGGMKEYLLIITEIGNSRDGDTTKRFIHVDLMIGLSLESERINIQ